MGSSSGNLEIHAGGQLDRSRAGALGSLHAGDLPESWNAEGQVPRRSIVRVVGDIGDLRPELKPDRFGQRDALEKRQRNGLGGGALDGALQRVAEAADIVGRSCECVRVNPLVQRLAQIRIDALYCVGASTVS